MKKVGIALYVIAIFSMIIIAILLFGFVGKDQFTELVWIEIYFICSIIYLILLICSSIKKDNVPFRNRNDVFGLLIFTVIPSTIFSYSIGKVCSLPINDIEVFAIVLLFIFTVIWFICRIWKYKDDKEVRAVLSKTAQHMAMFITLIGIAQTDLPNAILKGLFVVMGFTYVIFSNLI